MFDLECVLAFAKELPGKKVLIVDCDSQASQTVSLGWREDDLPVTLATLFALQLEHKGCGTIQTAFAATWASPR